MSVTEKPHREFWQLHLSTALIMMFVAGSLIYANVREMNVDLGGQTFINPYESGFVKFNEEELKIFRDTPSIDMPHTIIRYYGIPYSCNMFSTSVGTVDANGTIQYRVIACHWYPDSIVVNTLFSLVILFFVMLGCESLIRRREARKT